MFAVVSHDLRSPFNAILGSARLLKSYYNTYDEDKRKELIDMIFESSNVSFQLVEDLLKWSLIPRNMIEPRMEELNVSKVIKNIAMLFHLDILRKKISVHYAIQNNIYVKADKDMMSSVIRNLLSNAVKFTRTNGHIRIQAYTENGTFHLKICDDGKGIPNNEGHCVFDVEKLKSNSGTLGEKGMGLGLLLCKKFVELHNGKLIVKNREQKGVEALVLIPQD